MLNFMLKEKDRCTKRPQTKEINGKKMEARFG